MATVITPTELACSDLREIRLQDFAKVSHKEAYVFVFPSQGNESAGDLISVTDHSADFSQIATEKGPMAADSETCLYIR